MIRCSNASGNIYSKKCNDCLIASSVDKFNSNFIYNAKQFIGT